MYLRVVEFKSSSNFLSADQMQFFEIILQTIKKRKEQQLN